MTHTNPDTLSRGSYSNSRRVADILRAESVGGTVLLIATVLAVVLANTPASSFYFGLRDTVVTGHPRLQPPADEHRNLGGRRSARRFLLPHRLRAEEGIRDW